MKSASYELVLEVLVLENEVVLNPAAPTCLVVEENVSPLLHLLI